MRFIKTCIFVICNFISIIFLIASVVMLTQKNIPAFCFLIIISILTLILGIFMYRKTQKEKEIFLKKQQDKIENIKQWKEKAKLIPGSKTRIEALKANVCINVKHMTGLPVSEGALTYIYLCSDKIIFERNETTYNLELNKMHDITIKTDKEIQKAYVSSIGGAVAGGVLFGPLGAIIGGRTKEKTTQTISNYLIFAYDKGGENQFISFDVTGVINAYKFVEFFTKNRSRERKAIEL